MFDPVTANLLRQAPALPGLSPDEIPRMLTRHYARLVSARLQGVAEDSVPDEEWPLERIADTFELIASLAPRDDIRRACAFVAGTAQQIIARRVRADASVSSIGGVTRDALSPSLAAALLFLASKQYADANEASYSIDTGGDSWVYEERILSECIRDLARGALLRILERAERWRRSRRIRELQQRAFVALLEAIVSGIELLAAEILSVEPPPPSARVFQSSHAAFQHVLQLASGATEVQHGGLSDTFTIMYAGPRHLAALLLAGHDGIQNAALTKLPAPPGIDDNYWEKWLHYRAATCPFIWPNHRAAISEKFHYPGRSALIVLPTGAGKTTISSLKIAAALAQKKKVIFLAPTHALVEQLTEDLQDMFPKDLLGSDISSDFDLLLLQDAQLNDIEVMTPERCLAMLSFAPDAFSDVGLLVFDECHLLSPQSGKIRRSIDSMLCLLAFNAITPDADFLFLSAMLKEPQEFVDWITSLTGRGCVFVDLLWKPSRQARGVIVYREDELDDARRSALKVQKDEDARARKKSKSLRAAARKELRVRPRAIWGLQHNWLTGSRVHCALHPVADGTVLLAADDKFNRLRFTPNANSVASALAISAAKNRLKTIVFVNTKADAVTTARRISEAIPASTTSTDAEKARWDALKMELGDLKHALVTPGVAAVAHNSAMLRLERDLAERSFKRSDGAQVIVATPTLAQGLNLPAQLAILAGDRRASAEGQGREDLEAHEILNAAARAGRAGHLANGAVLLIPEPLISYAQNQSLRRDVVQKLRSILPEDDRCVAISDPLETVLDLISRNQVDNHDVRYTINRLSALSESGSETGRNLFDLRRSMAAYVASQRKEEKEFESKVEKLLKRIPSAESVDANVLSLVTQSGLSAELLQDLEQLLRRLGSGSWPNTVRDWTKWIVAWLATDGAARNIMLHDVADSILRATGSRAGRQLTTEDLKKLWPGLAAWLRGRTVRFIETKLGGDPDSVRVTESSCPRARELIGTIVPRGFSFIASLVAHIVKDIDPFEAAPALSQDVVESLSACVRKGFDTPELLRFANETKRILGRVQAHQEWRATHR